jgi:hypothetical protein
MATQATLRAAVFDYLYGAYSTDRPFTSVLTSAINNSTTTIPVLDGDDWSKGDILEVVETGEQCLVLSISTNNLTVGRSYGTVAATAAADAGYVNKNPRFTYQKVDRAITEVFNSFTSWGVHGFSYVQFTLVASQYFYELTETDIDDQYGVLSVYYPANDTEVPQVLPFQFRSRLSTSPSEWGNAQGIILHDKGNRTTNGTVYLTYAQSLGFDTDIDTTAAKLALPQEELVVLGAVTRMIGQTIIPATQDPGARTDRTTAPGQTSRDGRWFQGEFYTKVRAEAARLAVVRKEVVPGSVRTQRARRWRS